MFWMALVRVESFPAEPGLRATIGLAKNSNMKTDWLSQAFEGTTTNTF